MLVKEEMSVPLWVNLVSESTSATTATTETVECTSVFKAGSISVRKDMVARLPAMHISDFKRNLRDLERPSVKVNELKLTTNKAQDIKLCESSLRVLNTPNAGGNSVWSEVLSMELFATLYAAQLKATEMEIEYLLEGSITDYSVTMGGSVIGVSVTRAMKYRGVFSYEDALALLTKKLRGVLKSSENVAEEHKWTKQVLHVWVQEPYMVALVQQAYAALDHLWGNTLVQLTVCGENLGWIFK